MHIDALAIEAVDSIYVVLREINIRLGSNHCPQFREYYPRSGTFRKRSLLAFINICNFRMLGFHNVGYRMLQTWTLKKAYHGKSVLTIN